MKEARGHTFRNKQRIVCDIDPEDFEKIRNADLPGCPTMSARIRLLIEWGLMALDDDA